MKYSWKGHKDRNRHKIRIFFKKSGQDRLVYVWDINHNIPTTRRWARGDDDDDDDDDDVTLPLITTFVHYLTDPLKWTMGLFNKTSHLSYLTDLITFITPELLCAYALPVTVQEHVPFDRHNTE